MSLIYICCNINLPGNHGYVSHAGLLLFMCIHRGKSALYRVYWGRDLLGFPPCWLLHGSSPGCTCGAKCRGSLEPGRKTPLLSPCFCSTLALAGDYFQSMLKELCGNSSLPFSLGACPKAPGISSLCKQPSLLRHPFFHHRARRGAGNGLGWGVGLAKTVEAVVQYDNRGDNLGISLTTSAV